MFNTLIAEDNVLFRQTLSRVLTQRFPFMNITETGNGENALQLAADKRPDLIFMDIKLPGKNGLDVTKAIKAIHADAIVCIITSYDLPEYREAATHCGARHFIVKDESTEAVIVEVVESILAARLKTLVIEDNPSFRDVIHAILAAKWPEMLVVDADDGPLGLKDVAALKPDVVLLDLHLPTANGIDLVKPIKARHAQSAIVIVTAYDLPVYREAATRFGADYFVAKEDAVGEKIVAILSGIVAKRLSAA